jgi:hypothetical protein
MAKMKPKPEKASLHLSFRAAQALLKYDGYLSAEQLAAAISSNPDAALPTQLREYLVDFLLGKKKAKRGRKPQPSAFWDFFLAEHLQVYHDRLDEFQKKRRLARTTRRRSGDISEVNESPHELAMKSFHEHLREQLRELPEAARRGISIPSPGRLRNMLWVRGWLRPPSR